MLDVYFKDEHDIKNMLPEDKYQLYLKMVAPDPKKKKK